MNIFGSKHRSRPRYKQVRHKPGTKMMTICALSFVSLLASQAEGRISLLLKSGGALGQYQGQNSTTYHGHAISAQAMWDFGGLLAGVSGYQAEIKSITSPISKVSTINLFGPSIAYSFENQNRRLQVSISTYTMANMMHSASIKYQSTLRPIAIQPWNGFKTRSFRIIPAISLKVVTT